MTYCSIEEAWGSDFAKPKKKKKKNRKKQIEDPIDPEILIPDTREFKPPDVRVPNISFEDTSGIGAYDDAYDNLMSPSAGVYLRALERKLNIIFSKASRLPSI